MSQLQFYWYWHPPGVKHWPSFAESSQVRRVTLQFVLILMWNCESAPCDFGAYVCPGAVTASASSQERCMRIISQNAAFNQFRILVVPESDAVLLRPAAAGGSVAVLHPFGRPVVCVTWICLAANHYFCCWKRLTAWILQQCMVNMEKRAYLCSNMRFTAFYFMSRLFYIGDSFVHTLY